MMAAAAAVENVQKTTPVMPGPVCLAVRRIVREKNVETMVVVEGVAHVYRIRFVSRTLPVRKKGVSQIARARSAVRMAVVEAAANVAQTHRVFLVNASRWWMDVSLSTSPAVMAAPVKNVCV
jgi:hypothetical protein